MAAIYLTASSSSSTTRRRRPPRKERVTPSSCGHSTVCVGKDLTTTTQLLGILVRIDRKAGPGPRRSHLLPDLDLGLVVCSSVLTGLHFAFCIGISKRVPSTGPPAASRPSVHIKPAPAAARALSDAPTLQNVPIIHIAHWTKANSPHRFACQIQPRPRGPLKSSPKRSGVASSSQKNPRPRHLGCLFPSPVCTKEALTATSISTGSGNPQHWIHSSNAALTDTSKRPRRRAPLVPGWTPSSLQWLWSLSAPSNNTTTPCPNYFLLRPRTVPTPG